MKEHINLQIHREQSHGYQGLGHGRNGQWLLTGTRFLWGGGDKNIRELDGGDGRTALAQNH